MEASPLERAIAAVGSQSELARRIGRSQPAVWGWLHKLKRVPAEDVLAVAEASGIPRHELRPDLYPEAAAAAATNADQSRVVTCAVCDRRLDGPGARSCQALDCPVADREAA